MDVYTSDSPSEASVATRKPRVGAGQEGNGDYIGTIGRPMDYVQIPHQGSATLPKGCPLPSSKGKQFMLSR